MHFGWKGTVGKNVSLSPQLSNLHLNSSLPRTQKWDLWWWSYHIEQLSCNLMAIPYTTNLCYVT